MCTCTYIIFLSSVPLAGVHAVCDGRGWPLVGRAGSNALHHQRINFNKICELIKHQLVTVMSVSVHLSLPPPSLFLPLSLCVCLCVCVCVCVCVCAHMLDSVMVTYM